MTSAPLDIGFKPDDVVRLGFVTDLGGPYAHVDGEPGAEAIRMAIEDAGGQAAGRRVELVTADHRNDAAHAAATAAMWFDHGGLDVLIGGVNSASSLAMAAVARDRRRPFLAVGSGSTAHTNEAWSPYTIHYAYDTTALGRALGGPVVLEGGDSWYFLAADYPIGSELLEATRDSLVAAGGHVVGSARVPRSTTDFEPHLRAALASGARVLGLANTHHDLIATLRAVHVLGLPRSMTIASAFLFLTELHEVGLEAAQGTYVSDSWYWDRDEASRAFARRFLARLGAMPTSIQAANHSAAGQYLCAVEAVGSPDADAVLGRLHATLVDDAYITGGHVRADGRLVHDMYVYRVKSPAASSGPWDVYDLVATLKDEEAWLRRDESRSPVWQGAA